jgi:hypothetical protein
MLKKALVVAAFAGVAAMTAAPASATFCAHAEITVNETNQVIDQCV